MHPGKKGFLEFVFIGSIPLQLRNFFITAHSGFSYLGQKSLTETYELIAQADYCSLFVPDDINYSFSTKFYEYVALGKQIITFSRIKGNNADFIEKNRLGIAIDFETMDSGIVKLYESIPGQLVDNAHFDISDFNIARLTEKLQTHLI